MSGYPPASANAPAPRGEEGGVPVVGAGPDPQVAAVAGDLVAEEQPGQQGERAGDGLAGPVAVDVGTARAVRVGWDVERHLGLAEGDRDAGVAGELGGGTQDPTGAGQEVEEHRRIGRAGPVEVVADMAIGGGSRGDEPVDLGVGAAEVRRGDQPGENQIAALGERAQLAWATVDTDRSLRGRRVRCHSISSPARVLPSASHSFAP